MNTPDKIFEYMIALLLVGLLVFMGLVVYKVTMTEPGQAIKNVDSSVGVGESAPANSLDYVFHPVCNDAIVEYAVTNPEMVAYMCNMVGDIWVTDIMRERQ